MKKSGRILIASLLVVGLLVANFGSVFAGIVAPAGLADPVAKESFPGEKYTTQVLTQQFLPGIFEEGSLVYPTGFGPGQGQFSGSGLKISDLEAGETVTISFDFKFYNYMWRGSIYKWDGTRWVKLVTKIVLPTGDETMTWATVEGVSNGTYALIMGNYGVPAVVVPTEPV